MKIRGHLRNRLIIALSLFLAAGAWFSYAQEHDRIVEKVDVVNVNLPVRVFHKGEPVKGLTAENFKIRIDGKDVPINGFFEESQKISVTEKVRQTPKPRLFVLVFNINDYNMSLTRHLDTIFQKVIRPGDRLMIVTNSYFITDRPVKNLEKQKARLKRILEMETLRVKREMRRIEFELKGLVEELVLLLAAGSPNTLLQDFKSKYAAVLDDYKQRYANIMQTQGLKMAEYLKQQDVPKWVINFHQVGMFPQLKSAHEGGLRKALDQLGRNYPWLRADLFALDTMFNVAEGNMVKEISKYFLNSEVTFHTILMKGHSTVFLDHLDYKPMATEAETMMRRITKLTGGEEMGSNNVEKFIDRIVEKEDIYYVLSYNPGAANAKIKVRVTDASGKNYDVIYDNQRRPWYLKSKIKKVRQKESPQVAIKNVSYNRGILALSIAGIKMDETGGKGKIHLLIRILGNGSEEKSKVEKAFACKERKFVLRMKPPGLKRGNYDIMVQVTDLLTGKNDIEIKPLKI